MIKFKYIFNFSNIKKIHIYRLNYNFSPFTFGFVFFSMPYILNFSFFIKESCNSIILSDLSYVVDILRIN